MKRLVLTLALLPCAASAQSYVDSTRAEPFVPIANIPGVGAVTPVSFSNADNGQAIVSALPFAFNFFGTDYTRVNLGSNGLLTFGTEGATSGTNAVIPSTGAPNAYIAPLWDDLVHPAVANARWAVVGTAPNRVVVLEAGPASKRGGTGGTLYYQVWLYEGLASRFEYKATGDPGGVALDATIGYEGAAGRRGTNAGGCAPANTCASVPSGTTFRTERDPDPELSGGLVVSGRGALPGASVTGAVTLRNLGVDTATGVLASVYLSANNTFGPEDLVVGTVGPVDVSAASAGTSTTVRITVPAGLAPADYYVFFEVDSADDYREADEADNRVLLTPRFATAYELRPSSLTIRAPAPSVAGGVLGLSLQVQNDGLPWASPMAAHLYASIDRVLDAADADLGELTLAMTGVDPQTFTIDLALPPGLPFGGYYPIVVIDPQGVAPEILEANDTLASSARFFVGPDFAITSVTVPAQVPNGTLANITTRVDSAGWPYTGPVGYSLFASRNTVLDANDTPLGDFTVNFAGNDFLDDRRSLALPAAPGRYNVIAVVDPGAQITEISELNNTRASGVAAVNAPDLSISAVSFAPTSAAPGRTATVTATLRSLALPVSGRVSYAIHLSRDALFDVGDPVVHTASVTLSSATLTFSTPVAIPRGTIPGAYRFIVVADSARSFDELDEANNVFASAARIAVPGAELAVISMTGSSTAVAGAPYDVTLELANTGVVDAPSFRYAYFVSTNPLIRLTDTRVFDSGTVALAAGGAQTFHDRLTFPELPGSTLYLGVVVDPGAEVPEASEVDNIGRISSPIELIVPRPNLVARSVSAPANQIGPALSVSWELANTGSVAAELDYALHLSSNAEISAADPALGGGQRRLGPGESISGSDAVAIPAGTPPGRYRVGLVIDPMGAVAESREDDNVAVSAELTLLDAELRVLTESLPDARAGLPYAVALRASGAPVLAWSIVSGAPAGLAIDAATGLLSGTPASAGTATLRVRVEAATLSAERELPLVVRGEAPPLAITSAVLPPAIRGQRYATALEAQGGAPPRVWSGSDLPAGLTLAPSGTLTGTPSASARFTVEVRDGAENRASAALSLVVLAPDQRLVLDTRALPAGRVGAPYCASAPVVLRASGGVEPYAFALDGTPPPGLALSSSGELCGTPSAEGRHPLDVTVTDARGTRASAPLLVEVRAATGLAITTTGLPAGQVGVGYAASLEATGGRAPIRFERLAGGGALPPGVTLASSGALSGTPTAEGSYELRVVATDADERAVMQSLSLTIAAAPPVTPPAPEASGCGCASARGDGSSAVLLLGALIALRRRGARRSSSPHALRDSARAGRSTEGW